MSNDVLDETSVDAILSRFRAVVDDLIGLDYSRLSRDELVGVLRDLEVQVRRVPAVDARVVGEVDRRGVAGGLGCRGHPGAAVHAAQCRG